jgi:hypothetical protein
LLQLDVKIQITQGKLFLIVLLIAIGFGKLTKLADRNDIPFTIRANWLFLSMWILSIKRFSGKNLSRNAFVMHKINLQLPQNE